MWHMVNAQEWLAIINIVLTIRKVNMSQSQTNGKS